MGLENQILNKIDKEHLPKGLIDNNSKREKILALKHEKIDRFRPDLSEFADVVSGGEKEIEEDRKEVEKMKQIFDSGSMQNEKLRALKEVAEIYEGVLVDQIEANAWFGEIWRLNMRLFLLSARDRRTIYGKISINQLK